MNRQWNYSDPSRQLPSAGRLEVVATPIGNLGDLAPRARAALLAADLIAAEDTRRTGELLAAIGVSGTLISLHEHNESGRIEGLVRELPIRQGHRAGQRCGHAAAVRSWLQPGARRGRCRH